ncbi:hypothetical protein BDF21DRAFT_28845 [Thamnidium elegans]|nr:hypothetical protein BDF21DRAFT_28845 [Thamnidium elegans]
MGTIRLINPTCTCYLLCKIKVTILCSQVHERRGCTCNSNDKYCRKFIISFIN